MDEDSLMSKLAVTLFGVYLIVLNLALLVLLVFMWQEQGEAVLSLGKFIVPRGSEGHHFLMVAAAGAFGSYIHLATSFAEYAGNRSLAKAWTWWYILRPLIGAFVGVILFIGLLMLTSGSDLKPYALVFIGMTGGLLSKQLAAKFSEVFDVLFRPRPELVRSQPEPRTITGSR